MGPEEKWEDRRLWEEERRRESDPDELTAEDIADLKADEKYDDGR